MNRSIVPGPTYAEMRDPTLLPANLLADAAAARTADELAPINLFNINWKMGGSEVERIILPKELTGVQANIIVLSGRNFPSGSMKVGPAYTTLAEAEALNGLRPGDRSIIGPSTGNFGIGTAYVSALKGYQAIVVMPDTMSQERYERIRKYGGALDLTPGTESDVILTLERTHNEYVSKPELYFVLAQFELMPNYRFHRYVTGDAPSGPPRTWATARSPPLSVRRAAPAHWPRAIISRRSIQTPRRWRWNRASAHALQRRPRAAPHRGHRRQDGDLDPQRLQHRSTDADQRRGGGQGMEVMQSGTDALVERLGVGQAEAEALHGKFGPSCICNIIGAIKTAKVLELGPQDNVVTFDSYDRYPSVSSELYQRHGGRADTLEMWAKAVFLGASLGETRRQPARGTRAASKDETGFVDPFRLQRRRDRADGKPGLLG